MTLLLGIFELLTNLIDRQLQDEAHYNLKASKASLALKIFSSTPFFFKLSFRIAFIFVHVYSILSFTLTRSVTPHLFGHSKRTVSINLNIIK